MAKLIFGDTSARNVLVDSVDLWDKRRGSDGYFLFLEEWLGKKVEHDEKMNFSVLVGD